MAEEKPSSLRAWMVVTLAASFFGYQFMLRVAPNVINVELIEKLKIDSAQLGFILGLYNWAYAGMQIPFGLLMDRFGPRFFIGIGALLCSLSCFLFAYVETPFWAGVARFLTGFGSACGFLGTLKLGTLWFESKDMGKVIGLTYALGTLGATLGGAPLRILHDQVGYVLMLEIVGGLGLVLAAVSFLFITNGPHFHQLKSDRLRAEEKSDPLSELIYVMKNPQSWLVAIYSLFMYAPVAIFGDAWGVPFLEKNYALDSTTSAGVVSTMFIGAAVGSPFYAALSDMMKNRRRPMLVGTVLDLLVYLLLIGIPHLPLSIVYLCMFLAGFAYASKAIGFAVICEIMPKKISGISIAFVNVAVMSAGIIFHPLVGSLIKMSWDGTMVNNVPFYSANDYRLTFWVIPAVIFLSAVLLLFIRESYDENNK